MQELLRTGIYFGKLEVNLPIHQALFSGLELLLGLQLAASQQAQFQCPHGLELLRIGRWYCIIFYSVSMPSRAYTSFLRYPFKNLGFMRFPEPVFAGIYQNILTIAIFRAC